MDRDKWVVTPGSENTIIRAFTSLNPCPENVLLTTSAAYIQRHSDCGSKDREFNTGPGPIPLWILIMK